MPEVCGEPHPEEPGVTCDRIEHQGLGFHRNRETGMVWSAGELPDLGRRGKRGLADMAYRAESAARVGRPGTR